VERQFDFTSDSAFSVPNDSSLRVLVSHANTYPVTGWVSYDSAAAGSTSSPTGSLPTFAAGWSVGGQYALGQTGGGSEIPCGPGLFVQTVPRAIGTGYSSSLQLGYTPVVDPKRPNLYRNHDPNQGYAQPLEVDIASCEIDDAYHQPANSLALEVDLIQNNV